MKKIVHIDLNCFFVQAETLKDSGLKNKCVAVGYDGRRGVISTCSYLARKFGVHSGMPVSEAKRICPNLLVIPGHYQYYENLSRNFFSFLKKKFPILEQASIDECYIDMTDSLPTGNEYNYLFDLQMELYRVTNLKCSIGLGSNKFLAKMGSDYKKPLGLTIMSQDNIPKLLWPLDISKMYGVGKKTAPRLKDLGINTIGDLANCSDMKVRKTLGNLFDYLKSEANGYGDDVVSIEAFDPKSISAERTFSEDSTSYDELKSMIKSCSEDVAKELDYYQKDAISIVIKLRSSDFKTRSKRMSLEKPINGSDQVFFNAMMIFDKFYKGEPIRLIGVGVEKVVERIASVKENKEIKKEDTIIQELNQDMSFGGKIFLAKDLKSKK